jgi:hypothetical protein
MPAATYNLTIDQGSDYTLSLVVKENGAVKNLTGYSARAQMRERKHSDTLSASFTCTIPSPGSGGVILSLPNGSSKVLSAGTYFYDLELYTNADALVTRLLEGQVTLRQEVTR